MRAPATLLALALSLGWGTPLASASAAPACQESWSVSTRGLRVGISLESFELGEDGTFKARSETTPQGLAKLLGAPSWIRGAEGTARGGLSSRFERKISGEKTRSTSWERQAVGGFARREDGSAQGSAPADGVYAIDTTLLPRLAQMKWIHAGESARAKVFSSGSQPTPVQVEMAADGLSYAIQSASLRAKVEVDKDGSPTRILFDDGKNAFDSAIERGCPRK